MITVKPTLLNKKSKKLFKPDRAYLINRIVSMARLTPCKDDGYFTKEQLSQLIIFLEQSNKIINKIAEANFDGETKEQEKG